MERLAALAGRWEHALEDPSALQPPYRTQRFGRSVMLVRSQLRPLQSREALAESFRREAGRHRAVEAAYALRWLEMDGGILMDGGAQVRDENESRSRAGAG